jgi:hypothetical protein
MLPSTAVASRTAPAYAEDRFTSEFALDIMSLSSAFCKQPKLNVSRVTGYRSKRHMKDLSRNSNLRMNELPSI